MEKFPIIGGSAKEKEKAREILAANSEETKASVWGTREKTPEQLEWIDMVNRYVGEEMKDLGFEYVPVVPEQVRFLSATEWTFVTRRSVLERAEAEHQSIDRTISINCEEIELSARNKAIDVRLKEFADLLHETLHESGILKYDIRQKDIRPYRVGYQIVKEDNKIFQGFNEGVTELLTMRLLNLHKDEIKEKFGVDLHTEDDKDDKNSVWNYINRKGAAIIAGNVYEGNFDTLWKGYFSGKMMHLRGIEKKYGKGSLRVLSLLDDGVEEGGSDKIDQIYKFFDEETSPKERDLIRIELLGS